MAKFWPFKRGVQARYNEFEASGAASFFSTTYGDPDHEKVLPLFTSYAQQAYGNNAVLFAVILARLMLFSEAEFTWQSHVDRSLFGNADLAKLENPWPNGTTGELLARMEQDASLAGNAYIRDIPEANRLERLRPDRVTIISSLTSDDLDRPYREVVGYGYDRTGTGQDTEVYDVAEVAHWSPIPDPVAEFRGMSWLSPVIREVNADAGMTEYKIKYLDHAATPNLMVRYDQQLKPETITSLEDRLAARHGGVHNAFKTIVLDSGANYDVVGNSFEQMSFVTVQAAGENRIAAAGGVPGIVVGLKEGLQAATYSNFGQAMRRFADLTMRPQWRSACAALAPLLQPPAGARLWFDARNIAALQEGAKERADITLVQAQAMAVLARFGWDADSIVKAVPADDLTQLTHSGVVTDMTSAVPKASPPPLQLPDPTGNGNVPALNGATP
jgi:phage portal protein BeeE